MDDLISRQAAIDLFPDDDLEYDTKGGYVAPHLARRMICELPSAQPEIIRCKDCKHRDKYGCCKYWKGLAMGDIPIATDDYDFCSYAKRI